MSILWPNGWMNEDASWHGSRARHRPHCIRRGAPPRKGHSNPPALFGPYLLWLRSPISVTAELLYTEETHLGSARVYMSRVNERSPATHTFTHICNEPCLPVLLQPQCMTALWPVLISRPAKGRKLSWPAGWMVTYTEMVCPSDETHTSSLLSY